MNYNFENPYSLLLRTNALYSFLITIFQGFKSKYFISDLKDALATFKSWIMFVYDFLLNQKPVDSDTGKWVGFIFMVIVVIGFSMALIGTFGWLIHKLYTEYAYNWISFLMHMKWTHLYYSILMINMVQTRMNYVPILNNISRKLNIPKTTD